MIAKIHLRGWKGITGTFPLSARTILAGPNGSGKTALLDALAVALTGYTGLGKKNSATCQLASGIGGMKLCEIGIEDAEGNLLTTAFSQRGQSASMTLTFNGKEIKDRAELPESMRIACESIHPAEFLALSGDKRAAFLFGTMGDAAPANITPDQIDAKFPWFVGPLPASSVLDNLAKALKSQNEELDRCVANLQRLTGTTIGLPAGTLAEWKQRFDAATQQVEDLVSRESARGERSKTSGLSAQVLERARAEAANARAKIAKTNEAITTATGLMSAMVHARPDDGTIQRARDAIEKLQRDAFAAEARATELNKMLAAFQENGKCPTCGSCENVSDLTERWELESMAKSAEVAAAADEIGLIRQKIAEAEAGAKQFQRREELERQIKIDREAVKSYERYLAEQEEIATKAEADIAAGGAASDTSADVLQAQLAGARAARSEAQRAVEAFQKSAGVLEQKAKAEQDRQACEDRILEIKGAVEQAKKLRDAALAGVSDKIAAPFAVAVSRGFPDAEAWFEVVGANGKPEVDFGIVRQGRRIGFDTMSGGERLVILAALVAAIQIATRGKPALFLCEAAEADGLRADAIRQVVDAIGFEQVIYADCHQEGDVPAGYSVVDMGASREGDK